MLLSLQLYSFPDTNPFSYGTGSTGISTGVTSLNFQTQGEKKKVSVTEAKEPISFIFESKEDQIPETWYINATFSQTVPMYFHEVEIQSNDSDMRVLVRWDGSGWDPGMWVFAKLREKPSKESFDLVQWLPQEIANDTWETEEEMVEARHTFVMTQDQHCGAGIYQIGVMTAGKTFMEMSVLVNIHPL